MMKLYVLLFLTLFLSEAIAQDTIVKTNKTILIGKVLDITKTEVKYRSGGDDMPIRVLSKKNVRKIIYFNGFVLDFTKQDDWGELNSKFSKREMLASGFYLFGNTGIRYGRYWNSYQNKHYDYWSPMIGFNLGHKWYIGSKPKFRMGINASWVRTSFGFDEYSLAPLNAGLTFAFDVGLNSGIELHTYTGILIIADYDFDARGELLNGFVLNYRYKKFAIGIDYGGSNNFSRNRYTNHFNLSIGCRF